MNISKRKQGILAIICTIAMIVTSITVYNPREVKADSSATVGGKQYSATVKDGGEWTGFACQGIFDSARIHFAWGIDVDSNTITASIGETKLKVDGKSARGMHIPLSEVTSLEAGSYDIVINATTAASDSAEAKEISATVTLKIEVPEETTTRDPSVEVWKNIVGGTGYSYNDNTTVKVVSVQQPGFASEQGIYMTVPGAIESISINGVDSEKYALQGAGAVVYLSGLVKGENTINIKYAGGEATVIIKNENETIYTVSIDGTEKQYEEGATIAVPADGQGYYNVTKKEAYAPGTELTVNENMTLKSIKLSVTMTKGASIRLAAPTGLRFQTTVKSGNGIAADEILNSTTVTTGTLITTLDLYEANGKTLTKDSKYNFLDIANNGWFNDGAKTETGKFCGSIIKIQSKNYGRAYIAVGYATIKYSDGSSKTVCADVTENNAKSIAYVAGKVKDSEKFSSYSSEQQNIIINYINGKEISK
ncbi:hypothetical protein [Eubacterium ventriosum]|uniref:hypothetical protein n=1 Tax=Eubacterium ventriosum TaxID=39496 RepID=UPI000E495A46|nr:hypothetical protein [Eubacterium ventriosum]RHD14206.1 hypothetical protein DW809_07310 [Eubacterium ventriosum]